MILTQTGAMFMNAFRELHARKLFWVTVGLSGLVMLALALVGYEQNKGISFFIWDFGGTASIATAPKETFYRDLVVTWGINVWLTWIATIMAIVSTAGIIPSMVTDGAIDTVLSKPIGRLRLFLTKYLTGLMFVAVQVAVFCVGAVLLMIFRAGTFEPGILLAVPIVTLFFSYLYCVSALIGLLTRSSLTALMITALFWGLLILLNRADDAFTGMKYMGQQQMERIEAQLEYYPGRIADLEASIARAEARGEEPASADTRLLENARKRLDQAREDEDMYSGINDFADPAKRYTMMTRSVLPKTAETIRLLNRWLFSDEEIEALKASDNEEYRREYGDDNVPQLSGDDAESPEMLILEDQRSRSLWWSLGTSVLFEGGVLALCCFIFWRRDF